MKITIDNINEFKPYLGISDGADAGYNFIVKNGDLYSKSDKIKNTIDKSLQLINKIVSENEPKKTKSDDSKVKKDTKKSEKKDTQKSKKKNTESDTKKDTKKSPKTEKKDTKKYTKEKFGEKPYWYSILETYVKSFEGKEKQQWRVRAFVKAINQACNAKLGQKTPNIGIIRDIRNELIDLANNVDEKKVSVPSNSDLRSSCKEALKKYSITKTIAKPDLKKEGLSGCESCIKKKKK